MVKSFSEKPKKARLKRTDYFLQDMFVALEGK
jgi:hypothetical protein